MSLSESEFSSSISSNSSYVTTRQLSTHISDSELSTDDEDSAYNEDLEPISTGRSTHDAPN